ncbi:MAG: NfeD family protein [Nocardioides sp.]
MSWFGEHMWQTWLAVALLFGVAELFSLDLILIMLAGGATAAMLTAMLGLSFPIQAIVAAAASLSMLVFVRPSAIKRLRSGPSERLGLSKLIGERALVTEAIAPHRPGRVKLSGEIWTAESYDDTVTIEVGDTVQVVEIKGATAVVLPVGALEM